MLGPAPFHVGVGRSIAALRRARRDVERQPVRPVAAHFKEVIEVRKPGVLESSEERGEAIVIVDRSDGHDVALNTKFFGRECQRTIDGIASETHAFECFAPHNYRRRSGRKREWHAATIPVRR